MENFTNIFNDYFSILIVVICLIVGFILKKWIKDVNNKWIPTVCAVLGAAIAIWIDGSFTPETIATGLVSGLASTGLHQLVSQILLKEEDNA